MSQSLTIDAADMDSMNNALGPRGTDVPESRAAEVADVTPEASPQPKPYGIGPYRRSGVVIGWRVSINRRGDLVNRYFVAKKLGGMDQALQTAIAFRDEVNQTFAPLTKREQCAVLRSSNTSGIPGVFRLPTGEWKAGIRYADGSYRTRQFSVRLYGEDEARRMAIQARAELLALVEGHALKHEEMRNVRLPEPDTVPDIVITPHRDEPTPSPYDHPIRNKTPGVGKVNIKTLLKSGQTVITTYRVAQFKQSNGLPKRRYFSVPVYGEEEALRLATEQRQAWEREAEVDTHNSSKETRNRTEAAPHHSDLSEARKAMRSQNVATFGSFAILATT